MLLLCSVVLLFLFYRSFEPGHTLFSNDGPLATLVSDCHELPDNFSGSWEDLNSIGQRGGGVWVGISGGLRLLLGPVVFSKFYAPLSLLILGVGAWAFFRQLKLAPAACVLGGLAAMLNSGFFSAACWGVASHAITVGMAYLALAALADTTTPRRWARICIGGLAVGMVVMEGADIGALFSMHIAAFIMYQALTQEAVTARTVATGVLRVGIVAGFAAFLAAQTISTLVDTQIQGISGAAQDTRTREQRWDWATQWSLPKREALGFVVPGLFGYRMDTPEGGNYWGAVGRDPAWDRYFEGGKQGAPPQGFMRFSGGGSYAGILVALIGCWAVFQGFRKEGSAFSFRTRRWLWFWSATLLVSLLLAFGRFAPFYQLLYALPYFSTVRNPAKLTHLFNWAVVVLFAYGVDGLWQRYLRPGADQTRFDLKGWWRRVKGFDKRWTLGCLAALGASALGWLIYSTSGNEMVKYLQEVQFDATTAAAIFTSSVRQSGIWVVFLAGAIVLVTLVLSGAFSGSRSKWGAVVLGGFLVLDLCRANLPWIIYWNYEEKYATNPVIEKLREQPYAARVAILPFRAPPQLQLLDQLYRIEWAQHHFQFYNIQSLDIVQMPRMPEDLAAYENALQFEGTTNTIHRLTRRWTLTNTRYLLGAAGFVEVLNREMDPVKQRFRSAMNFNIVPRPGVINPTGLEQLTAVPSTDGQYGLIEFTGALPRAGLYSGWQVMTNDQAGLKVLTSPEFDPAVSVIVAESTPPPPALNTNRTVQPVEFVSYEPKHIVIKAKAPGNAVLLLNDHYDPNWKVLVDGKPEKLLRCNFIMRGVQLAAGEHRVEFLFQPPVRSLYVSLAALAVGGLLAGYLLIAPRLRKS